MPKKWRRTPSRRPTRPGIASGVTPQPTTWLYRITVNAALMRIRKDKRDREMTVSEDARPDIASSNWAESPVAATMNSELGDRIDVAINAFPEDLRVAVILRDVQSLSNQEAADTLDISVSALKARLHRGRIRLRDALEQYVAERSNADYLTAGLCQHIRVTLVPIGAEGSQPKRSCPAKKTERSLPPTTLFVIQ